MCIRDRGITYAASEAEYLEHVGTLQKLASEDLFAFALCWELSLIHILKGTARRMSRAECCLTNTVDTATRKAPAQIPA